MTKKINIAPGARLLSVIGRIPLTGWQCIAELIDNSIDAMIVKKKLDSKMTNRKIKHMETRLCTPKLADGCRLLGTGGGGYFLF